MSSNKLYTFFYTQAFLSVVFYLWICVVHYISAILYVKMCTPTTVWGFLSSPFMVMTPHCSALAWAGQNSRAHLLNMWFLAGNFGVSVFASIVVFLGKKTTTTNVKVEAPQPFPLVKTEDHLVAIKTETDEISTDEPSVVEAAASAKPLSRASPKVCSRR